MVETYYLRSERSAKTLSSLDRPKSILASQLASINMAHAPNAILIDAEKAAPVPRQGCHVTQTSRRQL